MWRRGFPFLIFAILFFLACLITQQVGAANYTYVPLTTPLISDNWDGDAKSGQSGTIDLSTVFGAPADIKAVEIFMAAVDESVGITFEVGPTVTQPQAVGQVTQTANQWILTSGISPCDSNGDIYFTQGGELDGVVITIWGYWIEDTEPTPQPTVTPIPTDTLVPTETPIPTDTLVPTETPIPTDTPEPTATAGWYVLTLTPPSGGGSSYDPDPFHTIITQTLSSGNQWAFDRSMDIGEVIEGGVGLVIVGFLVFRGVIRK